jgi:transposase
MRDLYHATHDDLIRIIREQDEVIAEQARRLAMQAQESEELHRAVASLTEQVGQLLAERGNDAGSSSGTPSGMPGLKMAQAAERDSRPRKRRAAGAGRKRMAPTQVQQHALRRCPVCGGGLSGGTVKRSREVIELAPPRIEVIEHQYLERRCPHCGKRCGPAPALSGVVSGQGRLGHRLTSLLVLLQQEARVPVRTIQRLLQTLTGLQLSVGAIVDASRRVAKRAEPVVQGIADAIRASPVVHLDETGWRQAGRNGFIWTASTPVHRRFT